MKKTFLLLTPLAFVIFALIPVQALAPKQKTLRFGAIMPLSNEFAASSNYIRQGIEEAVKDLQAENINVEVNYEDACIPTKAMSALNKLLTINSIDAIVSNFCVIALPALKSPIKQKRLITIQSSVVPDAFLKDNPYLFSSFPSAEVEAKALAENAYSNSKDKRVAILYLATPWGEEYTKQFTQHFTQIGGDIVATESKTIGDNNYRTELLRIKAKKPDAVFLVHFGGSLATLLKQMRQLGMTQRALGVQDAYDAEMLKAAGSNADGLFFFLPKVPEHLQQSPLNSNHPLTQHAYANTIALAKAFNRCKKEKNCISKQLKKDFATNKDTPTLMSKVHVENAKYILQ